MTWQDLALRFKSVPILAHERPRSRYDTNLAFSASDHSILVDFGVGKGKEGREGHAKCFYIAAIWSYLLKIYIASTNVSRSSRQTLVPTRRRVDRRVPEAGPWATAQDNAASADLQKLPRYYRSPAESTLLTCAIQILVLTQIGKPL